MTYTILKPSENVLDAAYPSAVVPAGIHGVMGYIGGPRAYHAWTLQEWLPFAELRQFPIYVPDIRRPPIDQGAEAVHLSVGLGWSDAMTGPEKRAIVLDMETSIDPAWYEQIANVIDQHGFTAVAYGSRSTVLGNGPDAVLLADWDNSDTVPGPIASVHGNQYSGNVELGGTLVDYSVFDQWLYHRGGVGTRRHISM